MTRYGIIPALLLAALVGGCTFDPLAGWQPPSFGNVTVGDAITRPGDTSLDATTGQRMRIYSIEPDFGHPAGDEPVMIRGEGFVSGLEVWFGSERGLYPQVQQGELIFVRTPPSAPGLVDVRVVDPAGRVATLEDGFLFARDLEITSIEPTEGPAEGGTPVTVRGEGFAPETHILVGGRRLIELQIVDENTALGITPGGVAGPQDVMASDAYGAKRSAGAFRYLAPVALTEAAPYHGPAESATTVVLTGSSLARDVEVRFGSDKAPIVEWSADGRSLTVSAPAGPPGPVDIRVTAPDRGSAMLPGGFTRVPGGASETLSLLALHPKEGGTAGGDLVELVLVGLDPGATPSVLFGERAAIVERRDSARWKTVLAVRTPPGAAGSADVQVVAGAVRDRLDDVFRYRSPEDSFRVTPEEGSYQGATEVVLESPAFQGLAGPVEVRFGPLTATDVTVGDDGTLTCRTPPGSPGRADVHVKATTGEWHLRDGFVYRMGAVTLFGVVPESGAYAGGTYVEILGADLPTNARVRFDNKLVRDVAWLSPTKVAVYSPAVEAPTSLDVGLYGDGGGAILVRAYSYFDPFGEGPGAWGGPIEGAVNVTVVVPRTYDPVPDAFVMLDADAATPYQGWTNENGQVTLSGPGLVGPRDVTATAYDFSAATYAEVDAQNVTLVIIPDNPPGGGTTPGGTLPNGTVGGSVDGIGKYVAIPVAPCDERVATGSRQCAPCTTDEDCVEEGSDLRCISLEVQGGRCLPACVDDSCPEGYTCGPINGEIGCVPSLGERAGRCELTRRSAFSYPDGDAFLVNPANGQFLLESRPGEVAVICFGGYVEWESGEFVPTVMGVRRHVFTISEELSSGQDVQLDTPLSRTVTFRMDPGFAPPGEPPETRLSVFLDFGSDGYYVMGEALTEDGRGYVSVPRAPAAFTGNIYDAGLSVYAGRYTPGDTTSAPYSLTYIEQLGDADIDRPAVHSWADEASAWSGELVFDRSANAIWTGDDGRRLVVGDDGLLAWSTTAGVWSVQPRPVRTPLYDVDGPDSETLVAVGGGGVVLRFDGVAWEQLAAPTGRDLRAVWVQDAEHFIAVGDHRIAEYEDGAWTVLKIAADLNDVAGRHWLDVWAVGRDGALLHRDSLGWGRESAASPATLNAVWLVPGTRAAVAVGDDGAVLWFDGSQWTPSDDDASGGVDLFAVHGSGPTDLVIAGDAGRVLRYDGLFWKSLGAVDKSFAARGVRIDAAGTVTVVGAPAVPIGPLLPVPRFLAPADGDAWAGRNVAWTFGPGEEARAFLLTVYSPTGGARWSFLAPGTRRELVLPDLAAASGWTPLDNPSLRLRSQTALWPAFDMDNFRDASIGLSDWVSWTYTSIVVAY